jgi:hypothetical protein
VDFLAKLVGGRLDVGPENIAALDRASLSGTVGKVAVHGKTGAGPMIRRMPPARFQDGTPATSDAWAVSRWCLPCTSRDRHFRAIADFRRAFALRLLTDVGLVNPIGGQ